MGHVHSEREYGSRSSYLDCPLKFRQRIVGFYFAYNYLKHSMFIADNRRVMAHGSLAAGVVLVRGAGAHDAVCRRPALQLPHSAHSRWYRFTIVSFLYYSIACLIFCFFFIRIKHQHYLLINSR